MLESYLTYVIVVERIEDGKKYIFKDQLSIECMYKDQLFFDSVFKKFLKQFGIHKDIDIISTYLIENRKKDPYILIDGDLYQFKCIGWINEISRSGKENNHEINKS